MPLIIPVGFAQAVYELTLEGDSETMVTTMGHDVSEVVGGDYEQIADRLHVGFGAEVMPAVSDLYTLQGVSLYVGQDGGPPAVFVSSEEPVPGVFPDTPLPQNCAALVRKRTGAAGRRGRGRMYIPGQPESAVSPTGVLSDAWLAIIQGAFTGWFELLTGVPVGTVAYPPYVLHRSEGIGAEPPPTAITNLVVDDVIATQRRRLRK